MTIKTVAGFVIAPVVIPLVFVVCDLLVPGVISAGAPLPVSGRLREGFGVGMIGMVLGYVVTLLGAVPMHVLFVRRGWTRWWMYAALGAILGIAPWLIYGWVRLWGQGPGAHYPVQALAVLMGLGAACGVPAATLFWAIAVRRSSSLVA